MSSEYQLGTNLFCIGDTKSYTQLSAEVTNVCVT